MQQILLWTSSKYCYIEKNSALLNLFSFLLKTTTESKNIIKVIESANRNYDYITCIQIYNDGVIRLHLNQGTSIFTTYKENIRNTIKELELILEKFSS